MSIFKDTLKPFVVKQIRTREEILSKEERDPQIHKYASGKLPWVKMTSFVDYKGSSDLSKKYILYGGSLYTKKNDDNKLSLNLRYGLGGKGGAYGSELGSNQYGFRPMPGISDVSTRCIQAYGSVTEATVKFYAWDVKQIDDLSILFLRPGYRVLLEWGWSMYLDTYDNGDSYSDSSNSNTFKGPFNKFSIENSPPVTIDCFNPNITQDSIYQQLGDLKVKYSANYDGVFGVIRNFNYTLMPNGGFECTVVLLDVAEVIDTIRINNTTGVFISNPNAASGSSDIKSDFELLMDDISKIDANYAGTSITQDIIKELYAGAYTTGFIYKYVDTAGASVTGANGVLGFNYTPSFMQNNPAVLPVPGDKRNNRYIQFNSFLYILNYIKNLYAQKNQTLFTIELCPEGSTPGFLSNGLCVASYNSISIDPSCCIIANTYASLFKDATGKKGFRPKVVDTEDPFYEPYEYLYEYTNLGLIGYIYLNIGFIIEVYKKQALENNGYVYLGPFLTEILSKMSFSLGSINDFGLYVKENKLVIIDKYYTESPDNANYSNKFKINISGKSSIIRSHKIESKIFPSQANMVAVAAQDKENIGSLQTSTYNYLNKDLTDRVFGSLVVSRTDVPLNELEARRNKLQSILSLIDYVNDYVIENKILNQFDASIVGTMNSYLNALLVEIEGGSNYRAIVPLSVDLNMDGVSGLVIGQLFTVNKDVLPKDYIDKHVGFIITGISSKIDSKEWITSIQSQMCLLDQEDRQKESLVKASTLLEGLQALVTQNKSDNINSVRYYNILAALTLDLLYVDLNFASNIPTNLINPAGIYNSDPTTLQLLINVPTIKDLLTFKAVTDYGGGSISIDNVLSQAQISALKAYPLNGSNGYLDAIPPVNRRPGFLLKLPSPANKNPPWDFKSPNSFSENAKNVLDMQNMQVILDIVSNTDLYKNMVPDVKSVFNSEITKVLKDYKNKIFTKIGTDYTVFPLLDPTKSVSPNTGRLLPLTLSPTFVYRKQRDKRIN